jgi:hypothetical protein
METGELRIWKGRIERSYGLQQQYHNLWKDSIDLYNCAYFNRLYGGFDPERVDVNFVNWYVDNLVPLVYFRDPFIFVKPKHDNWASFAETMETVINLYWRKLQMKQQFKRVIKSALLMPPGWIKTGYTAKIGQDIAKLEEIEQKGLVKEIKDTILGVFRKEKKEPTPEEQGILNQYIEEESIFANWVSSWNMLLPEGYQLIENMPYLIEIEDVPKIDFLANPIYKNKSNIKPSREIRTAGVSPNLHKPGYNNLGGSDSETDIIRLYHIQDRRNRKNYTLSMEAQEAHFEGDWWSAKDGFDYEPLIFDETLPTQDKSNPYPPNVILPILPQIIEQSQARTQMVKWRKRASAIILAQRGLATEEDMRQLEETDVVQLIQVSNIAAFQMSQISNLPSQIFDVDAIIKQDLQMGTNMGQLMFQAQQGQRTGIQAQISQSGLQLKASARVDVVEDFTVKVAKKLAYLLWNFYDRERISEIIGEPATEIMWPDLPDDPKERLRRVNSEMLFGIDAGSTAPPKDETVDRKQLLDFLAFAASFAPERLKKDETLKAGIKRWKFIKDIDKIVISSDDEEMQRAQLENQLMLAGHPQTVGPNEPHDVHLKIHQQAAGTPLIDQHFVETARRMGLFPQGAQQAQQGATPQEGDIKSPRRSIMPEKAREGIPSEGDIYQSSHNMGVGTGEEAM